MKFTLGLLFLLTLAVALIVNALHQRSIRIDLEDQVLLLKEAADERSLSLANMDSQSDFQRAFMRQRSDRKNDTEKAVEKFHQLARKNSQIDPDDSGNWFARRIPQLDKESGAIRLWVPDTAQLQLVVGFVDNDSKLKANERPLRSANHFSPPNGWSVELPEGFSEVGWKWTWDGKDDERTGSFEVTVNNQSRNLNYQLTRKSERLGQWHHRLDHQESFGAEQPLRVYGVTGGESNYNMPSSEFVNEQVQIVIKPVEVAQ